MLDSVILSRIQFGFTVSYHLIWPTLTIGLGLFLVLLEALWLSTGKNTYIAIYKFWVKIFALAFAMGVVTGIPLAFEFGTNFSELSRVAGPILGPLLSVEVMTAFFLEAAFIGVMLFGFGRVPKWVHFAATLFVCIGTHNSAFWILVANSWLQTPTGAEMVNGVFQVTSWRDVILNPSMIFRYPHMLFASYISGMLVVSGLAAWYLLKNRNRDFAIKTIRIAVAVLAILTPMQIFLGDAQGLNIRKNQPLKVAAMEGLWETGKGVPLVLFAIPDKETEANKFAIEVPKLSSFILTHDWDGEVQGLKDWPKDERPNVPLVFYSFRIMVGLGMLYALVSLFGLLLVFRKKLIHTNWFLKVLLIISPTGIIASLCGWFVTEFGRQPWVVYNYLRTKDAASILPSASVVVSLTGIIIIYSLMTWAFLYYAKTQILKGPEKLYDDDNEFLHLITHTSHITEDNSKGVKD